ncbi:MAG: type VI secretion system protein TssA [Gemmatimonadaceae bacterium]|nr:type VI secretion system protein TssA [Gemmatimonadaceae bacterium]
MPARTDLLEPLLAPIAGDNPSGRWMRDDPIYEKIKEARREDDDADQGAWQRARKVADHGQVIKLTGEVLAGTSKDLQLASWWADSMLKREGVIGLRDGVALMRGLLDDFWDTLYPSIEDGDASMRAGPMDFIGIKLVDAVRAAPMNAARHAFREHDEAALVGTEEETRDDDARTAARTALADKGQPLIEDVIASVDATPKAWYVALVTAIDETITDVAALDAFGDAHFADDAPSFRRLLDVLEGVQRTANLMLARRRLQEPDDDGSTGGDSVAGVVGSVAGPTSLSLLPTSETDAITRVIVSVRYLRRARPTDPAPYAMLRALRWQELRATPSEGGAPAPALLQAPPTAERARLKSMMLTGAHEDVLDGVEELLGATGGGAWLDAQRWAIDVVATLGADYADVARVLRSELRQLLADFPALPQATLLDDSPVANTETIAWLQRQGLTGTGGNAPDDARLDGMPSAPRRPMLERARAEVSSGRLDKGVALLMGDLARERSERARFLRRLELVTILVDAGRADIAMPIVEELLEQLDTHKLDAWEDGGVVAQALVLACRTLDATDGDRRRRGELYLRICRLDPIAALALKAS